MGPLVVLMGAGVAKKRPKMYPKRLTLRKNRKRFKNLPEKRCFLVNWRGKISN